jgi:hypothetical protein
MIFQFILANFLSIVKETLIANEEINVDVTSGILIALKHHTDSRSVVQSACMALSSLISILGLYKKMVVIFLPKIIKK